jgi:GxxExxY protein
MLASQSNERSHSRSAFEGNVVGRFRADLVVNETILVEAKAFPRLQSAHDAQLLNYLRATALEVGLLLNFGPRPQFRRLVFENHLKKHSYYICPELGR